MSSRTRITTTLNELPRLEDAGRVELDGDTGSFRLAARHAAPLLDGAGLDGFVAASPPLPTSSLTNVAAVTGATAAEAPATGPTVAGVAPLAGDALPAPAASPVSRGPEPQFGAAVLNPFGLSNVGSYASPTLADIDGDGDLDAFIGSQGGSLQFFRNSGSAEAPTFVAESSDFGPVAGDLFSTPTFADIDADGDLDAFVGSGSGNTVFHRNTGSATAPAFAAEAGNFGLPDAGNYVQPTLVDIDADGDLDAFIGTYTSGTQFFRNTGSATAPAFTAEGSNFGLDDAGTLTRPTFADIDGDGDLDAFIGNEAGQTRFFRNTGDASAPAFTAQEGILELPDVAGAADPEFVDIDADGDLDAFIGNSAGVTSFVINNTSFALSALATLVYTDTVAKDTFPIHLQTLATRGSEDGTLSYGILGGNDNGDTVSLGSTYGVLTISKAGGATTFVPDATALNALGSAVRVEFTVTASNGLSTESQTLRIDIQQSGPTETAGNDSLTGGNTPTSFDALGGNDTVVGGSAADYLVGGSGNDSLNGGGGADSLVGGSGNDRYTVDNAGDSINETGTLASEVDSVSASLSWTLGSNLERLTLTGGSSINAQGNALANMITGNSGDNLIRGGTGNDTLAGGGGNDVFDGGSGNDAYSVDSADDYIIEVSSSVTEIDSVTSSVAWTLGGNLERLTLGGSAAINGTGNALANTLTGNSASNLLSGMDGNDWLSADMGSDTLLGGLGQDDLTGGDGNDTLLGEAGSDTLTGSDGDDLLLGAGSWNGTSGSTTGVAVAGDGADSLLGGAGTDQLRGNAGNDTLLGGTGSDNLRGDTGNDLIDGGDDFDLASYRFDEAGAMPGGVAVAVTFNASVVGTAAEVVLADGLGGTDTLRGVEAVIITGSAFADRFTGSRGADQISGKDGNDTIDGGDGNDQALLGEVGNDSVSGGAGADTLDGGADNDTLSGGDGNDVISGGDGADAINGGLGNDSLEGGIGNDSYTVDSSTDVISETTTVVTEIDSVSSSVAWTLGSYLEKLTLTGSTSINGTGNTLANTITGNAGNNSINGGSGNDTLSGGSGNDSYTVDSATDVISETTTVVTEIDIVTSSVAWTLGSYLEKLTLSGTTTINGTGNTLANTITGNTGNNSLNGGSGNDTLSGGSGNDTLDGSTGNDSLIGSTGNDSYTVDSSTDVISETTTVVTEIDSVTSSVAWTLGSYLEKLTLTGAGAINATGNTLANTLTGNTGNNQLDGGSGNDILSGGTGLDIYRFSSALNSSNVDTVSGFVVVDDTLQLENSVFLKLTTTGALNSSLFRASTTGTAADSNDFINYETDTGKLFYDADGNGTGAAVLFATLTGAPAITSADIFVT